MRREEMRFSQLDHKHNNMESILLATLNAGVGTAKPSAGDATALKKTVCIPEYLSQGERITFLRKLLFPGEKKTNIISDSNHGCRNQIRTDKPFSEYDELAYNLSPFSSSREVLSNKQHKVVRSRESSGYISRVSQEPKKMNSCDSIFNFISTENFNQLIHSRQNTTKNSIIDKIDKNFLNKETDKVGKIRNGFAFPKRHGRGHAFQFPERLYCMLEETSFSNLSYIVSWKSDGTAFIIKDKKMFVDRVLKKYFNQSKWESFQRQLNIYGFKKRKIDKKEQHHDLKSSVCYHHAIFSRDNPFLCSEIKRTKISTEGNVSKPTYETLRR